MKKLILGALLLTSAIAAEAQNGQNMEHLSTWQSLPGRNYNDVWGYAANGREYAIIGSTWGTHFIDVTNPYIPVEVDAFAGSYQFPNGSISWRDYKTYGHYVYAVADANNQNTLQIFDVSGLPNTVTKVYDSQTHSRSAHTVALEGDRLYLVSNRRNGNTNPIDVFSLADPTSPQFLATIGAPLFNNMHAIHVRNDTIYASTGYGGLYIVDATNPASPTLVSSITNYPNAGYNHTAWTSGDRNTLIFTDEVPSALPVKVYDISDIENPVLKSTFTTGTFATPHNTFMIGDIAILSYYKDGVQVYDLSDPANPVRMGYFDTYHQNDSTQNSYFNPSSYNGAWGVYPYLPSGNILVSDITNGLFVVSPPYNVNATESELAEQQITVYPNPAHGQFSVRLPEAAPDYRVSLFNALGQQVQLGNGTRNGQTTTFTTAGLAAGLYVVRLEANGKAYSRKLTLQ